MELKLLTRITYIIICIFNNIKNLLFLDSSSPHTHTYKFENAPLILIGLLIYPFYYINFKFHFCAKYTMNTILKIARTPRIKKY